MKQKKTLTARPKKMLPQRASEEVRKGKLKNLVELKKKSGCECFGFGGKISVSAGRDSSGNRGVDLMTVLGGSRRGDEILGSRQKKKKHPKSKPYENRFDLKSKRPNVEFLDTRR